MSYDRPKRLRVAIVGAGLMGRWHAVTARHLGAEIVAVADPDRARASRIAGSSAVYDDCGAMLDRQSCDVVHICTPSATHDAIVRLASAHGADALVEKPLARDGAATRALVEVTGKAGTRLCPVHQYAFQRGVEQIRDSLHRVGDNALIDLDFRTAGAVGCDPADYARIAADILPHPISILQRLVPSAADGPVNWQISGQPNGTFTLSKVADSALIRITISLMARPTCATLAVSGSKGSYVSDMFHGYALFRDGTATRQSKMMRPFLDGIGHVGLAGANLARRAFSREAAYPGLRTLCSRFYASVQNQTPPPISPDEMIQVAAIRDGFLARLDADSRAGPT